MKRTIATLAVAAIGFTGGQALAGGHVDAVSIAHSPRVCRSAATWGPAPDAVRPCARITTVEEDGSVGLEVSEADGTIRYTTGVGALDR